MAINRVKALVVERNGFELEYREETNPHSDLHQCLGILCDDKVTVTGGDLDPRNDGFSGEIGSIYISTDGNIYQKTGTNDTDWIIYQPQSTLPPYKRIASQTINSHRILALDSDGKVFHADNTVLWHRNNLIGLSKQSATTGNEVEIAVEGDEVTESSWNWNTTLPIFLSTNGQLTQTTPTTGFVCVVAETINPTTIRIKFNTAIITI